MWDCRGEVTKHKNKNKDYENMIKYLNFDLIDLVKLMAKFAPIKTELVHLWK